MINKLIAQLEEIYAKYEDIYEYTLQKKACIISNDAQKLNDTVKKEWELISFVMELEEKRIALTKDIASEFNLDLDTVSLADIAAKCPAKEAAALNLIAEKLKEIFEKQKVLNAEVKGLIDLHLEYVDYMVNMFLVEPQTNNIYGNSGVVEDGNTKGVNIFDSQV